MKYLAVLLVKYTFHILAQLLQVVWNISLHLDSGGFKQVIYLRWETATSLCLSFILFVLKKFKQMNKLAAVSQATLVLTSADLHAYNNSVK